MSILTGTKFASSIAGFTLLDLCPKDLSYMRYYGSLTTPPCSETVVWTVLTTPQKITEDLMETLRSIWAKVAPSATRMNTTEGIIHMVDNFRPLQPLNNRVIRSYADPVAGSQVSHRVIPVVTSATMRPQQTQSTTSQRTSQVPKGSLKKSNSATSVYTTFWALVITTFSAMFLFATC